MAVGKTSLARSVISQGNYEVRQIAINKKSFPYTYDPAKNWVVTGRYDTRECGGLDGRITNAELMKAYLCRIMKEVRPDVIITEAVMYGHTFKFGHDLSILARAYGYEYIGISLEPSLETVLSNVYKRNNGKPIKEDSIVGMYVQNSRSTKRLKEAGVRCDVADSSKYKLTEMYKIIERYTGEKETP